MSLAYECNNNSNFQTFSFESPAKMIPIVSTFDPSPAPSLAHGHSLWPWSSSGVIEVTKTLGTDVKQYHDTVVYAVAANLSSMLRAIIVLRRAKLRGLGGLHLTTRSQCGPVQAWSNDSIVFSVTGWAYYRLSRAGVLSVAFSLEGAGGWLKRIVTCNQNGLIDLTVLANIL